MAITKIKAIKHTVSKAIDYICDTDKTKDNHLYSFNCTHETAALEFELTAQQARKGENKAYHMVQSFRPNEVTPEQAHLIARQLADKVLKGKYEYVLCTHTDKAHIHSHIIFNAVSFKDHKRYKSDKKSYYRLRRISDELCNEYGIEPVKAGIQKKKFNYKQKYKKYVSKKSLVKKAIDEAVLYSLTYEDFLKEMQIRGYYAREDDFLWFCHETDKRFTKTDTIGFAYKAENIKKRIKGLYKPKAVTLLIDIESNIKCQQSRGYEHWATLHNLQTAAKTLMRIEELGFKSYESLSDELSAHENKIKALKSQSTMAQKRITEIDKIIQNSDILQKYLLVVKEYNVGKLFKKSFYNKHRKEIDSYNKAITFLKPHMVNKKYPNPKNLNNEKVRLQADIAKYKNEIEDIKSKHDELSALKQNIDIFLGKQEQPQQNRSSLLTRLKENQKKVDEINHQQEQSQHRRGHINPEL